MTFLRDSLIWTLTVLLLLLAGLCLLVSAESHELSPEGEAKVALCSQIASGAGARMHDVKMEFRWLSAADMEPIWRKVQETHTWPMDAFYIRDDGETAEQKAVIEQNVMLGWKAQDALIAAGKPPVPSDRVEMECLHRAFNQTDAGTFTRVASSEGLHEEQCRSDAAQAMMLWRLEIEYGKTRDDAWRLMGQSHSEPPSDTQLTRWQAWVSDWRALATPATFLNYAQKRCMGSR